MKTRKNTLENYSNLGVNFVFAAIFYIWVQIKFRKIGWIDNYLYIIENKFQIFLKNLEILINFSNFQIIFF